MVERYHMGVFLMIKEFLKEEHRTHQEMERVIAGNNQRKNKKEQVQREQRLATVIARYGAVSLDDYLRGVAYNLHFGVVTDDNSNFSDDEVASDEN